MHNNNFVVHTKQINARQETTGAIQEHSIVTILHLWSRKVVNMAINLIARSHTYRPISYCQLPENSWPFSAIRDPLWLIILSPSISLGSRGKKRVEGDKFKKKNLGNVHVFNLIYKYLINTWSTT